MGYFVSGKAPGAYGLGTEAGRDGKARLASVVPYTRKVSFIPNRPPCPLISFLCSFPKIKIEKRPGKEKEMPP